MSFPEAGNYQGSSTLSTSLPSESRDINAYCWWLTSHLDAYPKEELWWEETKCFKSKKKKAWEKRDGLCGWLCGKGPQGVALEYGTKASAGAVDGWNRLGRPLISIPCGCRLEDVAPTSHERCVSSWFCSLCFAVSKTTWLWMMRLRLLLASCLYIIMLKELVSSRPSGHALVLCLLYETYLCHSFSANEFCTMEKIYNHNFPLA